MGNRALENRIKSLKEEIKKGLEVKDTEELNVGIFIIRFTSVLSSRFDTKRFKEQYGDFYNQFTKQTASGRFTIS